MRQSRQVWARKLPLRELIISVDTRVDISCLLVWHKVATCLIMQALRSHRRTLVAHIKSEAQTKTSPVRSSLITIGTSRNIMEKITSTHRQVHTTECKKDPLKIMRSEQESRVQWRASLQLTRLILSTESESMSSRL